MMLLNPQRGQGIYCTAGFFYDFIHKGFFSFFLYSQKKVTNLITFCKNPYVCSQRTWVKDNSTNSQQTEDSSEILTLCGTVGQFGWARDTFLLDHRYEDPDDRWPGNNHFSVGNISTNSLGCYCPFCSVWGLFIKSSQAPRKHPYFVI